jgi:hypothetical protein
MKEMWDGVHLRKQGIDQRGLSSATQRRRKLLRQYEVEKKTYRKLHRNQKICMAALNPNAWLLMGSTPQDARHLGQSHTSSFLVDSSSLFLSPSVEAPLGWTVPECSNPFRLKGAEGVCFKFEKKKECDPLTPHRICYELDSSTTRAQPQPHTEKQ